MSETRACSRSVALPSSETVCVFVRGISLSTDAGSSVDTLITMDTYTGNFNEFVAGVDRIVAATAAHGGLDRVSIGLCTDCGSAAPNVSQHLDYLRQRGVHSLGVWDMPIPDAWFPLF
jgi:hypothetical protein